MTFCPLQRGLFWARPESTVAFDAGRRGTKFENLCPTCGQYESVTGATPVYLVDGVTVEGRGFVRTDLEFGSADEKTPVVLCGDEAQRELKKRKLKGVDLMPVQASRDIGARAIQSGNGRATDESAANRRQ